MTTNKQSSLLFVIRLFLGLRFAPFVVKALLHLVRYSTLYIGANPEAQYAIVDSFLVGITNAFLNLIVSLLIVYGVIKNKHYVWMLGIIYGIFELLAGVYVIYLSPKSVALTHPVLVNKSLFYLLFWNALLITLCVIALKIRLRKQTVLPQHSSHKHPVN